jgi:hypothetical protein
MLYALLFAAELAPISTPYAQKAPLVIRAVRPEKSSLPCFEPLNVDLDLSATFENPFDPADVAVDATVTPPTGRSYSVPGYFDRPYDRKRVNGMEVSDPAGPPRWRLRLAALTPGLQRVTVTVRDRSGVVRKDFSFTATKPATSGFVRVSPRDHRYFESSDGRSFFPIGENLCWGGNQGTADYDRWIPALGNAKANWGRLWLSPAWTTFALERPGPSSEGRGMGQFDLANASRLDYVLGLADRHGVKLMLTIDSFNILRDRDGYNYWEQTPHNAANGGPLRTMDDFWTNAEMARLYRGKLRYLIARYGAYASVFAWEFWNEVDVIRDMKVEPVRAWHAAMSKTLKGLDPYHHPVTTSLGETAGRKEMERASGIDYYQTHHYSSPDLAATVAIQQARKASWGGPHHVSEIAADVSGDAHADKDKEGYQAHDPIWASVGSGSGASAAPWFWDSLIEPNRLYPLFTSVARFVDNVDYPGERFKPARPSFVYAGSTRGARQDLTVIGEPAVWNPDPLNRPQIRTIKDGKFVGGPITEMLHGIVNHPDWHNPISFQIRLDRPAQLEIEVGRVSGHGGAILQVEIDGRPVYKRDFTDTDAQKTDDLGQYAGTYRVPISAGAHALKVENVGTDWFAASYHFIGIAPPSVHPPIDAWSIIGKTTTLGWARVAGRTWPRVVIYKNAPVTAPASIMRLDGLPAGAYQATLWNTWTGTPIKRFRVTATGAGTVRLPLPIFDRDLAFKLVKVK